jgi:hypothetical protein
MIPFTSLTKEAPPAGIWRDEGSPGVDVWNDSSNVIYSSKPQHKTLLVYGKTTSSAVVPHSKYYILPMQL